MTLRERIQATAERMQAFACECEAIQEPHRKRDCQGMWQAVMRGEPVRPVATVTDAKFFASKTLQTL